MSKDNISDILNWFYKISNIPRCSKNEAQIRQWLIDLAKEKSFECKHDKAGNILIKVPATKGYEYSGTVILQSHMDMVCEKTKQSNHNFETDGITTSREGDWLVANGTTLGADNGIGMALAINLALDKEATHPALELLFTTDEETGLHGALQLDSNLLSGKILINLDSESEGTFIVGCAGGRDTILEIPVKCECAKHNLTPFFIKAAGMTGGHSGIDISIGRANAIKILARVLDAVRQEIDFYLVNINGGMAHNAIPREAGAIIILNKGQQSNFTEIIASIEKNIKYEYRKTDPHLNIALDGDFEDDSVFCNEKLLKSSLTKESTNRIIDFLLSLPHGTVSMDQEISSIVQASSNLASVRISSDKLITVTSQRSSILSSLEEIGRNVQILSSMCNGSFIISSQYPPWQPDFNSRLVKLAAETFNEQFNRNAETTVIHAGLECGIIGDKYPGMELISFGPTIENPHSPNERLNIPSIGSVYELLTGLMQKLCSEYK